MAGLPLLPPPLTAQWLRKRGGCLAFAQGRRHTFYRMSPFSEISTPSVPSSWNKSASALRGNGSPRSCGTVLISSSSRTALSSGVGAIATASSGAFSRSSNWKANRFIAATPGGHLKLPHRWPGQIPPAEAARRRDGYTLSARFATRAAASFSRQLLPSNLSKCA
jgi:hypothetical protein